MAAAPANKLSDRTVNAETVKFRKELWDDLPNVDLYYVGRVFNNMDTRWGRSPAGRVLARQAREDGVTWQQTLRQIAREICLQGVHANGQKYQCITNTRHHLTQEFVDIMGFYGVVIDIQAWTWHESVRDGQVMTAEWVASQMN